MPKPSRDLRPSKTNTDSMLILDDATCTTSAAHDGMAPSDRRLPIQLVLPGAVLGMSLILSVSPGAETALRSADLAVAAVAYQGLSMAHRGCSALLLVG